MEDLPLDEYAPLPPSPEREAVNLPARDPLTQIEDGLGEGDDLGVDRAIDPKRQSHPRAKLDGQRLLGNDGLPVLRKLVSRVKFKGKGHEKRDLTKLLSTYQIWGHRLFPKANFDDVIALCRRAGNDREVRTWRQNTVESEMYGNRDAPASPLSPASPSSPSRRMPRHHVDASGAMNDSEASTANQDLSNLFTGEELEAARDMQAEMGSTKENNINGQTMEEKGMHGKSDDDDDDVAAAMEIYNDLGL